MKPIAAFSAICLLALAGCGGPTRIEVPLAGRSPLNVNEKGESTPVQVRLYQLRSDARFKAATADSLWTGDKDALKDDLVAPPTVATIMPGAAGDPPVRIAVDLDPSAAFLGVLALCSKADARDSRTLVIPAAEAGSTTLVLSGYGVAIDAGKAP